MILIKGKNEYVWDYKNRLVSASAGGNNIGYKYSYVDLRLEKKERRGCQVFL